MNFRSCGESQASGAAKTVTLRVHMTVHSAEAPIAQCIMLTVPGKRNPDQQDIT